MPKAVSKKSDQLTISTGGSSSDDAGDSSEKLIDGLIDKVIERIDMAGLEQTLVEQLSVKLGGTIRVENLADTILGRRTEELSEKLTERLLSKMLGS